MQQTLSPEGLTSAGFYFNDPHEALHKIHHFIAGGPDNLHLVADFDLTLTSGSVPVKNLGTWDVMDSLMDKAGVEMHTSIYQSLRPIELAGKLTTEFAVEKWSETLDLICSYRMTRQHIRDAFLGVAQLRDGGKELFDLCQTHAVPSIVLSAGIRDVIEIIADHYKVQPTHILSTSLLFDEHGRVCGWDRETLVHMLNKRERGHKELTALQRSRPNIVLLGDVPDDVHMANSSDTVLRIRVLDTRPGETLDRDTLLNTTFAAGYDLAIDHSLKPVVGILNRIITKQ